MREAYDAMAEEFRLADDERRKLLPSGKQSIFENRVGWARTYLKKAGLVDTPRWGHASITEKGLVVLGEEPDRIDNEYLKRFDSFVEFITPKPVSAKDEDRSENPMEILEAAHQNMRDDLKSELLEHLLSCSPSFFEKLVIDVLIAMGYGGSRQDAGQALGRSGDEGIDGSIKEDRLGLDTIYTQAKRWQGPVGRPEIQKFAGALQGQRARKGIFITTSSFTQEALDFVSRIESRIVLIDGARLAELMTDHNVGVSLEQSFEIKRVDSDYFAE